MGQNIHFCHRYLYFNSLWIQSCIITVRKYQQTLGILCSLMVTINVHHQSYSHSSKFFVKFNTFQGLIGWEFEHKITNFCHWIVSFHTSSCTEKTTSFHLVATCRSMPQAAVDQAWKFFNEWADSDSDFWVKEYMA